MCFPGEAVPGSSSSFKSSQVESLTLGFGTPDQTLALPPNPSVICPLFNLLSLHFRNGDDDTTYLLGLF